jgi:hypothetical protein
MRSDIVPGGIFPDYELPDHINTMRRLSELQSDDPLVLTLACHRTSAATWAPCCPIHDEFP